MSDFKLTISDRSKRRTIDFFSEFSIEMRFDSVGSTFSFSFYYNPDNPDHVFMAQVGKYQVVRFYRADELLITGLVLSQSFSSSSEPTLISFSGYSVPGVLEDSSIPIDSYPLQYDGLSLKEITEKLLRPFDIDLEIDPLVMADSNKRYKETAASETQTVSDYICSLAKQRDIVVSNTNTGKLLFTKIKDSAPVLRFGTDLIGTSYSLTFDGQAMSHPIVVLKQADDEEGNSSQYILNNPYVPADTKHYRPKTIIQTSGDDTNTEKVAINELKSELKSIKVVIYTDRWLVKGEVIKPNRIIEIQNKDLYLFKYSRWFIESVELNADVEKTIAKLTCVLPDVYNLEVPKKNVFYS